MQTSVICFVQSSCVAHCTITSVWRNDFVLRRQRTISPLIWKQRLINSAQLAKSSEKKKRSSFVPQRMELLIWSETSNSSKHEHEFHWIQFRRAIAKNFWLRTYAFAKVSFTEWRMQRMFNQPLVPVTLGCVGNRTDQHTQYSSNQRRAKTKTKTEKKCPVSSPKTKCTEMHFDIGT